jgi:arylsulfatase A-like enzyme
LSLGTLLASFAALLLIGCSDKPARPRGVLVISIDSLRADHLSAYGYKSKTAPGIATSPNIDARLAAQGRVFEQAFSTTSWTLPAHMALLTGLPDELHGVKRINQVLEPSRTTLAMAMQKAGWRTAGFFSGINLHPTFGFDRGFERYVDCSNVAVADPEVFASEAQGANGALSDLQRLSHQGVTSPKLVAAFDEWFETVKREQNFFAFVHFWDVHYDYAAPAQDDVFYPDYAGDLDGSNFWRLQSQEPRDPADLDRLISLYDAEIRFTDRHIGLLLDRLASAGRLEDTLVILVSDHGEEFFEHGLFGHYHALFDEVVRVPMIMSWPRGIRALRSQDLVSLADVAPTVLELCDVARPDLMWGRSLADVGLKPLAPRSVPLELSFQKPDNFIRGIRAEDYKVLQHSKHEGAVYFDLSADPGELRPIEESSAEQAVAQRIDSARNSWQILAELAAGLSQALDQTLPEHIRDLLNRSGYAGSGTGK